MALAETNTYLAELMCDCRGCPAAWQQQVQINEGVLKFCQHHHNELHPLFAEIATSP